MKAKTKDKDIDIDQGVWDLQGYILKISGQRFDYFKFDSYLKTLFAHGFTMNQIKEGIRLHYSKNKTSGFFRPGIFMKLKNMQNYIKEINSKITLYEKREEKGSYNVDLCKIFGK